MVGWWLTGVSAGGSECSSAALSETAWRCDPATRTRPGSDTPEQTKIHRFSQVAQASEPQTMGCSRDAHPLHHPQKHPFTCENICAPGRIRTCDTGFRIASKPSRWWYRKVF